jgi:hypothetical protein
MSSYETQPDPKRGRKSWTGDCSQCGATFTGDGAWNTRAAHERTCGQVAAPTPVTSEASDDPFQSAARRDPASLSSDDPLLSAPRRDPASPSIRTSPQKRRASEASHTKHPQLSSPEASPEQTAPKKSGRRIKPVELYNPLLEAARPQWGLGSGSPRSPAPRQSLGTARSPVKYAAADRRFEPLDLIQIPALGAALEDDAVLYARVWRPSGDPGADLVLLRRVVPACTRPCGDAEHPDNDHCRNPEPQEARALSCLHDSRRDPDQATSLLERRDAAFRTAKLGPGPSACDALLVEHGGDVQYAARLYAPEKRAATRGALLARLYGQPRVQANLLGGDDSSLSNASSASNSDDDGPSARVAVADAWEAPAEIPAGALRPVPRGAKRRFYRRARATWGADHWTFDRGRGPVQTTCPLICEPGRPRARYAVLPVDFYVDSDDGHAMLVFRWFYKKADIDRKALAALKKPDTFDARDELALGRGIFATPLEYVRGATTVFGAVLRRKAYYCMRDYDEAKGKLYKRQLYKRTSL